MYGTNESDTDPERAGDESHLLGLDNVPLELPLAGIGSRSLAAVIDYGLLIVLVSLWWTAGLVLSGFVGIGEGIVIAILTFGSFLLQWGYFTILELVMDGQTPGKSVLELRVVSRHGGRPDTGAILVRNLVRAVDLIFGLPSIAWDRRSRRLGDFAAGTLVVHERVPKAGEELRLERMPPGWGAAEVATVESFLRRSPRMEPAVAQQLAGRLLRFIERRDPSFVANAGETEVLATLTPQIDRVALLRRLLAVTSD